MEVKVPLFKVFMSDEAKRLAIDVLSSGYVGQGSKVDEFEARLKSFLDLPRAPVTVCSGTVGLDLIWHLLNLRAGDEVISTPMTCSATNVNLVTRGVKIVWADVDPVTGLIDPEDVACKVSTRTRAIVAVDWAGRVCDYRALKRHGVPVVEDAAHSLLSTRGGEQIGRCGGDYVMWSFQAIKHLTCCDGGAILVPESQDARARLLRWYGFDRTKGDSFRCSQDISEAGYKYHMNDLSAAVGLGNLPWAEWVVGEHRKNAAHYHDALSGLRRVAPPPPDDGCSWWIYCVLAEDQKGLIRHLASRGIAASPVHSRNDRFSAFDFPRGPLPGVDRFCSTEVAIPVGWWLTRNDLDLVVEAVREWGEVSR